MQPVVDAFDPRLLICPPTYHTLDFTSMKVKTSSRAIFFLGTRRRVAHHYIKKNKRARALTTTPHVIFLRLCCFLMYDMLVSVPGRGAL
jgi:hypothetical protein